MAGSSQQAYVNPLAHAFIASRGRVDEGVDFGMNGGYLSAITYGRVVFSTATPSGWPGEYIAYQIDPGIELGGAIIYYAEGVSSLLPVGFRLKPGDGVCDVVPGGSIEIGLAGDNHPNSWAKDHGQTYDQVNSTNAGVWFNQLLALLHAPTGIVQGTPSGPVPGWSLANLGGIETGALTPAQEVAATNPSTIIRHDFYQFGQYGRKASANANRVRALLENHSHTTTRGPA